MTDAEVIRVLIADDHPIVRQGLRTLLASVPRFEVVAEASDGSEAVALALDLQPDVVVMDLHMPGVDGIEASRQVVAASPHIGVLVLTMFDDDASVFAALRAGARGYILKGSPQSDILRALEACAHGEAIFGPAIAAKVLEYFSGKRELETVAVFPELTDRERTILNLVAEGVNNQVISRRLNLSVKTVRNHVSNIFTKLHVADRAEAIVRAREQGLGTRPPQEPSVRARSPNL